MTAIAASPLRPPYPRPSIIRSFLPPACPRTQQIMLRRRFKTVESYRAGAPNRDNRHFGDA
ncbi:hypothetical protein EON00_01030 [Burkholderia sp. ISTR5]|nr:hypothetical protein [Burkholderia sp. ISTR5]